MEFSKPEYWSVQPFPFPGDLPNPGIETKSPASQVDSLPAAPPGKSESRKSSHLVVSATPWSAACQASLTMGFSRQEYWSRLPFPSPGDLPNLGIKLGSPTLQADSLPIELQGKPMDFTAGCQSHFFPEFVWSSGMYIQKRLPSQVPL